MSRIAFEVEVGRFEPLRQNGSKHFPRSQPFDVETSWTIFSNCRPVRAKNARAIGCIHYAVHRFAFESVWYTPESFLALEAETITL